MKFLNNAVAEDIREEEAQAAAARSKASTPVKKNVTSQTKKVSP
jgi:hypothetical protein